MPMLQAFKGLLDCEMAATTSIDTDMNIIFPTLTGIVKIDGRNLSLSESEDLDKLRKSLRFKDRDSSYIDKMSVRGIINNDQLEIFPFILDVDRYTVALSGIQQFDQRFKYHVAAIKSPVPFKFGVNLKGVFSDWKWKLTKAKFKSTKIPLFDDQVDGVRVNLVNSIHNIFERGVEKAMFDWCERARCSGEKGLPANPMAAPAQRMEDFCLGRVSKKMPPTSYFPGVISAPLHEILPPMVAQRLQKAFPRVRMKGYYTNAALLLGVESRTSSPVRIPRDPETLEYPAIKGVYPCGEGAGYSGGIVSSAMDGIRVAQAIAESLRNA